MPVSLTSRVAWLIPALLIVEACASGDRPTAPRLGPEFAISDGVHEGRTPGFYFLPPMVSQPTVSGTLDADIAALNPQIAICDVTNGPDADCGGSSAGATPAVVIFTPSSAPAITIRDRTDPSNDEPCGDEGETSGTHGDARAPKSGSATGMAQLGVSIRSDDDCSDAAPLNGA